ncbi:hypothetical protein SAMN04489864_106176 [Pedobacter insulae]|uniref:Uncharacterized protein n=1 Tax=Pedobacter insulae TaxID=414048 RepID=A0A1I2Y1Z7_9SPHI|nr:hypothetical protein SAMN04489864_106176 [Pedobacter insulae]
MKDKEKHTLNALHKLVSYFMVLLFLAFPIVQVVHWHAHASKITTHNDSKLVIDNIAEQCKICDFLAHKQLKEFHMSNSIELVVPIVQPVKTCTNLISGNYTFTLNGFTNKGPPTPLC